MKKIFIFIMVLFCSARLSAEEEPSGVKLDIEDYKRVILSEYSSFKIQEFEEFATLDTGEKFFLCMESDKGSSLFAFNKELGFRDYYIGRPEEEQILDILTSGLPGVRIWYSPATIGDFNNDGHNEIAALILRGSAYTFWILGIDPDIKDVVYYFNYNFYVDYPPTFTPVEFMKYKGVDGFKMLRLVPPLERASIKYPFRGNKSISWFFYTWDERERKYVMVEEFVEDWEKSYKEPSQPVLAEQNTGESADGRETQKIATPSNSGKSPRFIFYIAIAVGVTALSLFFVVRRKKG